VPAGRPPELDEPRGVSLNIRLHEIEREAVGRAALDAGLSLSEWSRAVLMTAAGSSQLLEQLARIEPALEEKLDTFRRRRLPEIVAGRNTPPYTPRKNGTPQVFKRARFQSGVVLHIAPQRLVWPPPFGRLTTTTEAFGEAQRIRADFTKALMPNGISGEQSQTVIVDEGYLLPCVLGWGRFDAHRGHPPEGFARLHRAGFIETVLTHQLGGGSVSCALVEDLRRIVASQLVAVREIRALAPVALALSVFGMQGSFVEVRDNGVHSQDRRALYSDEIFLPIVTIPGWDVDVRAILREPLDALWRLGDYERCAYLDDELRGQP
jgi:hypothetical protein